MSNPQRLSSTVGSLAGQLSPQTLALTGAGLFRFFLGVAPPSVSRAASAGRIQIEDAEDDVEEKDDCARQLARILVGRLSKGHRAP